jgi:hypothetical protein
VPAGVWLVRVFSTRNGATQTKQKTRTAGQKKESDQKPVGGDKSQQDDGKTVPQNRPEPPTMPQGRPGSQAQWRLEFITGEKRAPEILSASRGMRYGIGRPYDTPMDPDIHHIALQNRAVTRGAHAILFLKGGGAQLVLKANLSSNPVYVGDNCGRELAANEETDLDSGQSFWLSTAVQVRVSREG